MLVLTRRENQSIMIGHDVTITVLEVRGDQVRIGIKAPRSIPVHREEVYAELRRENLQASEAAADDTDFLPTRGAAPSSAPKVAKPGTVARPANMPRRPARAEPADEG